MGNIKLTSKFAFQVRFVYEYKKKKKFVKKAMSVSIHTSSYSLFIVFLEFKSGKNDLNNTDVMILSYHYDLL